MTDDRLIQHAQRHFMATVRSAEIALKAKTLADMQQRAEGVSDYPQDIARRIAHQLHAPLPPVPPLPLGFDPGPDDEDARAFAARALIEASVIATKATTWTNLPALQTAALLVLAFGDAAEVRLRIALREARGQ